MTVFLLFVTSLCESAKGGKIQFPAEVVGGEENPRPAGVEPLVPLEVHPLIGRHGEVNDLGVSLADRQDGWVTWYSWQAVRRVTQGTCTPTRAAISPS